MIVLVMFRRLSWADRGQVHPSDAESCDPHDKMSYKYFSDISRANLLASTARVGEICKAWGGWPVFQPFHRRPELQYGLAGREATVIRRSLNRSSAKNSSSSVGREEGVTYGALRAKQGQPQASHLAILDMMIAVMRFRRSDPSSQTTKAFCRLAGTACDG